MRTPDDARRPSGLQAEAPAVQPTGAERVNMKSMVEEDPWLPLAAAYALGALEADERSRFEAHADACPECRSEAAAMSAVTGAIASSEAQVPPASDLRQ